MKQSLSFAFISTLILANATPTLAQSTNPTIQLQGSTSGVFNNPQGGTVSGVGTNNFAWGVPGSTGTRSSLEFSGQSFNTNVVTGFIFGSNARQNREFFSLGDLEFFNGTIQGGTGSNGVDLDVTVEVTNPLNTNPETFTTTLTFINSPNTNNPIESADSVFLPASNLPPVVLTASNNAQLSLDVFGFGSVSQNGFTRERQFFVLEDSSANAELIGRFQNPCEPIVNGAVNLNFNSQTMDAAFTPNFGLSLSDAAQICGYDHFNWYQVVTNDPYPPGGLSVPYIDPPVGGGSAFGGFADNLPFYWDEQGSTTTGYHLSTYTLPNSLIYTDTPAEPQLQPGEFIAFNSSLVGVYPNNSFDVLYNWQWKTNFNGTSGGVSTRRNILPPDNNGSGGIFDVELDLSSTDLSEDIINQMIADGGQNATLLPNSNPQTTPEPSTLVSLLSVLGIGFTQRKKTVN